MIGLALVATVSVAAQSTKASVSDLVDSQLTADYVLNGGAAVPARPSQTTVEKLPEVASVADDRRSCPSTSAAASELSTGSRPTPRVCATTSSRP